MKPVNTKLRSINTKFWDDSYVIDLVPNEKLLFLYLLTNPLTNLAGVYEITFKKISFDTGLELKDIKEVFSKFEKDKKIIYSNGFIIIKNFLKNQSCNDTMLKNVEKTVNQLPSNIKKFYIDFVKPSIAYHSLSISCDNLREIESESEIEKEDEIEKEMEGESKGEGKQKAVSKPNTKKNNKGLSLIKDVYNQSFDSVKYANRNSLSIK
jgi:hypothetical protein